MRIPIVRGVTFLPYVFTFQDAEEAALDFTGCTAFADAAVQPGAAVAFSFNPEITDAAAGQITFPEMTPAETLLLPTGTYSFDLVVEDGDGRRTQYLSGSTAIVSTASTLPA